MRQHVVAIALAIVSVMTLVSCGGVILGTSKTLSEPLGLQGRSANMDTSVSVNGLTTHLTASGTLQFTLSDQASSGDPLAPYEGMSRMEVVQKMGLVFSISSTGALPTTFTLRDVSLRIAVRVSDSGGGRTSPQVEFTYSGFLTLDRQSDGTYRARESLLLSSSLDRFDGSNLIAILVSGGANTVTASMSFSADTSSPNIPSGATVITMLQFDEGSATIRW